MKKKAKTSSTKKCSANDIMLDIEYAQSELRTSMIHIASKMDQHSRELNDLIRMTKALQNHKPERKGFFSWLRLR